MRIDEKTYKRIKAVKSVADPQNDEANCIRFGIGKTTLRTIRNTKNFAEYQARGRKALTEEQKHHAAEKAADEAANLLRDELAKLYGVDGDWGVEVKEVDFNEYKALMDRAKQTLAITVIFSFFLGVVAKIIVDALLRR